MIKNLPMGELLMALSVFALIFAVWQAVLLIWAGRKAAAVRRMQERLGLARPPTASDVRTLRLWHEGREATTEVMGPGGVGLFFHRMTESVRRAGLDLSPAAYLLRVGLLMLVIFLATLALTRRIPAAVGSMLATILVLHAYVQHRINRHEAVFERQFLDALHVAATSLRAGHPISGAFRFVSIEIDKPVGRIFAEMCQRQELGLALEDVVRQAAIKTPNADMQLFATSVVVHLRSGGNLADMMERLAGVVRDRMGVSRRVRVLTAQSQLSKRVLVALPVALFAVLNLLNPRYMEPLYTTFDGKIMLGVAAVMVVVGVWVMNRLVVIDF